jgi:hypothetical protein
MAKVLVAYSIRNELHIHRTIDSGAGAHEMSAVYDATR